MPLKHTSDPDPILEQPYNIRRGLSIHNKRDLRDLVYTRLADYCRAEKMVDYTRQICTRPAGHPVWWKHVAADGYEIRSVWGGGNAPADGALIDPEDGSPVDPADLVAQDTVKVGNVYKLRDRVNKLVVLGGLDNAMPRKDGWIEVLDFTTREQRAVPVAELVDAGYHLTLDEVVFEIEFAQGLRLKMRDQAVKNYHAGKWCENGLQDGLRDLGLPKYVPTQSGTVSIQVPYTALSNTNTSVIKEAIQASIDLDELRKRLNLDPENDDELTLDAAALKIAVEGVHRR